MLTTEQALRLGRLQERIYRCVEDELNKGDGHKSYEGSMEIILTLPSIFDRNQEPSWMISLHAYVLPLQGRHEHWKAKTLSDALAIAEAGIDEICAPYEMARFERNMSALCDDDCEISGGTTYGSNRHQEPEF